MSDRPSRLELAQLVSGDLPEQEAARVRAQLEGSAVAREELAELERNTDLYNEGAELQRRRLVKLLEQAASSAASAPVRPRWRQRWLLIPAATAVAAAAAVVFLVVLPALDPPPPPTDPAGRIAFRGSLGLQVVARRGAKQFSVKPGQQLAAGDALRFVVTVATPGHVTIFSVDGRGSLTPFYPERDPRDDPRPLALPRKGRHELPGSVVLDDAPGPEHLVVIFSGQRFSRARVHQRALRALRKRGALSAAGLGIKGTAQVITIEKQAAKAL